MSSAQNVQKCCAYTQAGTQCTRRVWQKESYTGPHCQQHARCTAMAGKGKNLHLCKNYELSDTRRCRYHQKDDNADVAVVDTRAVFPPATLRPMEYPPSPTPSRAVSPCPIIPIDDEPRVVVTEVCLISCDTDSTPTYDGRVYIDIRPLYTYCSNETRDSKAYHDLCQYYDGIEEYIDYWTFWRGSLSEYERDLRRWALHHYNQ